MSAETLMNTKKAESDFCCICLRTKAELKLDPIPTKMFETFFVELVKCKEEKKNCRSICVWCRRRVFNSLKLVETAQKADRILLNSTKTDTSHNQLSEQIGLDQIQANKRTHFLTLRNSKVISYSVPLEKELLLLPVKQEREDNFPSEDEKFSLTSLIEEQSRQIQASQEKPVPISKPPPVVSTKKSSDAVDSSVVKPKPSPVVSTKKSAEVEVELMIKPEPSPVLSSEKTLDAEFDLSVVKQEYDDDIVIDEDLWLDATINEDEVDHDDVRALERNNLRALRVESETDGESTSQLKITRKAAAPRQYKNMKKRKSTEFNWTKPSAVPEPIGADGDQDVLSEAVNDDSSSESEVQVLKKKKDGESTIEVEDSDTNLQAHSTTEALKYIRLLRLKKDRELEEGDQNDHRTDNAAFKCEPCSLGLTTPGANKVDTEQHSGDSNSRKCVACGAHVKNKQIKKARLDRYACLVCGFYFSTMQVALDHYMAQHATQWHKCEHCAREFRNTSGLKIHVRRVHNAELPFFPCKLCSLVLNTTYSFNQHVAQHNRIQFPNLHHCKTCSETFSTTLDLSKHKCTRTKKKFICEYCGDVFKQLSMLHVHNMKNHSDVRFECDHCQKKFRLKPDLRLHITSQHAQVALSGNLLVEKVNRTPEELTEKKDNVCNECGQRFSRTSHLINHRRSHSTARPYPCTFCSATYKHSIRLERHVRLMHKNKI